MKPVGLVCENTGKETKYSLGLSLIVMGKDSKVSGESGAFEKGGRLLVE